MGHNKILYPLHEPRVESLVAEGQKAVAGETAGRALSFEAYGRRFDFRLERNDRMRFVDNVIICAGQEPQRELEAPLAALGVPVHRIGGADVAAELDAKRAIQQGTTLGLTL